MFSALRENSLFYILEKGEKPSLKIGQVRSVSQPIPKYNSGALSPYNMESYVDISVQVNDKTIDFKQLPSSQSIANFGGTGMVVAETRELMSAEVESMIRTSKQVLESITYHENVLGSCEDILKELNPQFAKEKEQEQKIDSLEVRIGGIETTLTDMKEMLSRALTDSSKTNK